MPTRLETDDPTKEEALQDLRTFLTGYSDEIPEQIMRGEGDYKARIAWFNGVTNAIKEATTIFTVPDPTIATGANALRDSILKTQRTGILGMESTRH